MKLKKIKNYFRLFGVFGASRFFIAEISRRILDPYCIPSYSQTGEDRILNFMLGDNGFYVDVGCNHPQRYSNTLLLYKYRGWRGITIDGNEELIRAHRSYRKVDESVCAVVSDQEKELTFTEFESSTVSSLDADHIKYWEKYTKIKSKRTVQTVPLTHILNRLNAPKVIDLLCIDVEGHDFEVLSSLDLSVYRPRLIVIEMHGFDLNNPEANDVFSYLTMNSYKLTGYVVMNGYFVDRTAADNAFMLQQ